MGLSLELLLNEFISQYSHDKIVNLQSRTIEYRVYGKIVYNLPTVSYDAGQQVFSTKPIEIVSKVPIFNFSLSNLIEISNSTSFPHASFTPYAPNLGFVDGAGIYSLNTLDLNIFVEVFEHFKQHALSSQLNQGVFSIS